MSAERLISLRRRELSARRLRDELIVAAFAAGACVPDIAEACAMTDSDVDDIVWSRPRRARGAVTENVAL